MQRDEFTEAAVESCKGIPIELLLTGFIPALVVAVRECFELHGVPDTEACKLVSTRLSQVRALNNMPNTVRIN